ncbi:MAG: hypothetical protein R2838_15425 [Caldilineaceae bacterium]
MTGSTLIASASLIASLTGSGAAIGGLFVVRVLAPFLISPFAGVAADRYNRKHLLVTDPGARGGGAPAFCSCAMRVTCGCSTRPRCNSASAASSSPPATPSCPTSSTGPNWVRPMP